MFPLYRPGSFVFLLVAEAFWILTSTWQWKEEAMLCEIHMRNFKSHFWWDFLACCTRPVSVHLAMACVGCSFNSFWIFLLSLKQQQNLMKIMFSCIHFPIILWPHPPKIMIFKNFILVNCMGWQVCFFTFLVFYNGSNRERTQNSPLIKGADIKRILCPVPFRAVSTYIWVLWVSCRPCVNRVGNSHACSCLRGAYMGRIAS